MQDGIGALTGLDVQQLARSPYRSGSDGRSVPHSTSPKSAAPELSPAPQTPTLPMHSALAMALSRSHTLCGSLVPTLALDSSAWYSRFLVQMPTFRASKHDSPPDMPTFFMAPQLSQVPFSLR